ncbi:MAG: biotin--[acetyl-CoA-carboxylase] ligase [Thermodesulfobacteriota bacterium]
MVHTTKLIVYEEVASTQDIARKLAQEGDRGPVAVMALRQTSGRGRSGRPWISPPGKNLALSVLLRPKLAPQEAPLMGLLASVAVARVLEAKRVPSAALKWPNDVLVDGRKIAGILPEASVKGNTLEFVIIGIGLNVNSRFSDFPIELHDSVTSVLIVTGREWDLQEAAHDLLKEMDALYDRVIKEGCGFIPSLWGARWAHKGRMLTRDGLEGRAEGIGPLGSLILRASDGRRVEINSGEAEPTG